MPWRSRRPPRRARQSCGVARPSDGDGNWPSMQPDTKYANSGDVRVAYQVTGEGPVDLVLAPGTASHLDLEWEWPEKASFLERAVAVGRSGPLDQGR